MSILKHKILLAQKTKATQSTVKRKKKRTEAELLQSQTSNQVNVIPSPETPYISTRRKERNTEVIHTKDKGNSTKNIVKNYGSAIISFSYSELSKPYLEPFLEEFQISSKEFTDFVDGSKSAVTGITSFRNMLMINEEEDDEKCVACKSVFQKIAEVFIKYFSVNWIFSGKVTHKLTYLKYRGKMLRRIQNPELFIYLKSRK